VIGTIRRECLDRTLFWTTADLELKLLDFQRYYNGHHACGADRAHARLRPGPRPRERPFVPLAGALSWAVSDADRGVTCGRRRWLCLFESRAVSIDELPPYARRPE
jgi:hypothetical protein